MKTRIKPHLAECISIKKRLIVANAFCKTGARFIYNICTIIKRLLHRNNKTFFAVLIPQCNAVRLFLAIESYDFDRNPV